MKRLIRSTGFKITAVILMILTFCITLLGAVSMIYFIDRGFYDNTKDQLKKNQYHILAYNDCYDVMDGILYGYVPVQKEQEGYNFRYQVYDYKNNTIADSTYNDEDFCFSLTLHYYYDPFSSQHYSDQWYNDENPPRYTITGYVLESLEYEDKYRINSELIDICYDFRYTVILITGITLLLTCILLILLLVGAGRRNTDEDIHLTFFDYWPYDLLLLGMLLLVILVFEILNYGPGAAVFLLLTIGCILCVPILLTTAVRLKARVLFRYTLCYHLLRGLRWLLQRIAHGLKQLIQNLPLLWQVLTGCIVICLIEAFFMILVASYTLEPVDLLPLWIIEKIILTGGVLYITLQMLCGAFLPD